MQAWENEAINVPYTSSLATQYSHLTAHIVFHLNMNYNSVMLRDKSRFCTDIMQKQNIKEI